jgi:hypothetical protein
MTESQFTLEKFKLIQGGGVEIHWEEESGDSNETFYDKDSKKSAKIPHPDVFNILNQMKPMFAKAYDYSFIRDIILRKEFLATHEQAEIAENTYQEILKKISITGISVSGKGEKKACVITATYVSPTGKKRGVATEPIKFGLQKYGFEDELDRLMNDLESESYEFLVNNKKASVSMGSLFGKDENDEPTIDGQKAASGEGSEKE